MDLTQSNDESGWERIAPVVDEALHALTEADRRVILMRHVDRQSGQQLASRLGISESAARKQLERAMARLRDQLTRRGVAVGSVALATLLAGNLQAQVPPGLARFLAKQAIYRSSLAPTATWLKSFKMGVAACATLVLVGILLPFTKLVAPKRSNSPVEVISQSTGTNNTPAQTPIINESIVNAPIGQDFLLRIVDEETGEMVPRASVCFGIMPTEHSETYLKRLQATNGLVRVHWTNDYLGFFASVTCDGYADTRVEWNKEQGVLPVPDSWTLRLERAPQISGIVVDQQGLPIPSAKVKFWAIGEFFLTVPDTQQPTLKHPLRLMSSYDFNLETQTDAQGRWAITRIARQVQNAEFIVEIEHPDYLSDRSDLKDGNQLAALQSGEYKSVMVPHETATVIGKVVDDSGNPLPDADVSDGTLFSDPGVSRSGDRYLKTDTAGRFSFDTRPGWNGKVTAKAPGYAPRSIKWAGQPLTIALQPGRSLRIQVLSKSGIPIEGIRVESMLDYTTKTNPPAHYELSAKTDAEGRVSWEDVPNEPLLINFWSDLANFRGRYAETIRPSETEQIFVLEPALKITGTVVDAETRQSIPEFRVAQVDGFAVGETPPPAPFALPGEVSGKLFEQGRFELLVQPSGESLDPSSRGTEEQRRLGIYLKITAPGHAAYTSRFIDVKEGEVNLQISLKRAMSAKIRVLNPSGNPEPGATAEICQSTTPLSLRNDWKASGDYVLATDADGNFNLPADESIQSVIVRDRSRTLLGWARAESLRQEKVLRLSKLHTVEFSTTSENKTAPAQTCTVELSNLSIASFTTDTFPMRSQTDSKGKCSFQKLPEGKYEIRLFTPSSPSPSAAFSLELNASAEDTLHCELPL